MNKLMPIILLVSDGEDEAILQITPISGVCANGVANIRTYEALKEWLDRHHATVVAFDQPAFVGTVKVPYLQNGQEEARADRAEAELKAFSFIPSGREHEIACSFADCDWGQGLAGMGRCSGHGNPRDPQCPKFTTEASDYNPEAAGGTLKRPCSQCVISGSDCDHCGPPAWEGFVGTADAEGGQA